VGAGGGIGQALSSALIEEGAHLAALDMQQMPGAAPDSALALIGLNVRKPAQVAEAFDKAAAALGGKRPVRLAVTHKCQEVMLRCGLLRRDLRGGRSLAR
jgi:NAD(P)-dependent dehydrogenase (short-subunit alcohol dehydrogenase family)